MSSSGLNVTGATTVTAGTHDVNSGSEFSTNSLSISNGAALRMGANATNSTITIGAGGLTLNNGSILFGSRNAKPINPDFLMNHSLRATHLSPNPKPNPNEHYEAPRHAGRWPAARSHRRHSHSHNLEAVKCL